MDEDNLREVVKGFVMLILVAALLVAGWLFDQWNSRQRAAIYADEFQRRGMAPQAVPK